VDSTTAKLNYQGYNVEVRFVNFTPTLCDKILKNHNTKNRPVTKSNVVRLTKEMKYGNWLFNGETIIFDEHGNLSNGQHRLESIINSGEPQIFVTVSGLDETIFTTIDVGRKRTGGDILSISDIPNATQASAILKIIHTFKKGKYSGLDLGSSSGLENSGIIEYYHSLDGVERSIRVGGKYAKTGDKLVTCSILGAMHYLFSEVNPEKADEFIKGICLGTNLSQGSPIVALRHKLIKNKIERTYKLSAKDLVNNIFYAWEKYLAGATAKTIKLPANYVPSVFNIEK
jgi:hypothetical protein